MLPLTPSTTNGYYNMYGLDERKNGKMSEKKI